MASSKVEKNHKRKSYKSLGTRYGFIVAFPLLMMTACEKSQNVQVSLGPPSLYEMERSEPMPESTLTPVEIPEVTPYVDRDASSTMDDEATDGSTVEEVGRITLKAVGDDLLHQKVVDSGKQEDGSYNYDHLFDRLADEFDEADFAVINQETIFGTDQMGYSGYPRFCSPMAVGDAIVEAGFDIVLHATNHVLDKGIDAITNTIDYWKTAPSVTMLGIHETSDDFKEITIIEKNGITLALLNYTYGYNGFSLPQDKYYMAKDLNRELIKADIKRAKEIADFIIVFPHWGSEYVYKANIYQRDWTTFFSEQGVDLVIGTHPHVLQPIEWITSSTGRKMLVYYSLGNYISSMDYTDRMLGGIANVTIVKKEGVTCIEEASITPIVTHYERGFPYQFTVYRLCDYDQELAGKHYIKKGRWGRDFSLAAVTKLAQDIVGDWIQY